MKSRELYSIAETLLLLLDASAVPMPPVRGGDGALPASGGQKPLPVTEETGAFPIPKAAEAEELFFPQKKNGAVRTEAPGLPGAENGFGPAAETPVGAEDVMERIDDFFRRDSRRYDSGFTAYE